MHTSFFQQLKYHSDLEGFLKIIRGCVVDICLAYHEPVNMYLKV